MLRKIKKTNSNNVLILILMINGFSINSMESLQAIINITTEVKKLDILEDTYSQIHNKDLEIEEEEFLIETSKDLSDNVNKYFRRITALEEDVTDFLSVPVNILDQENLNQFNNFFLKQFNEFQDNPEKFYKNNDYNKQNKLIFIHKIKT